VFVRRAVLARIVLRADYGAKSFWIFSSNAGLG